MNIERHRELKRDFLASVARNEYRCPVCGDDMEQIGSHGFGGINHDEDYECPTCNAVLRVDCRKAANVTADK